VFVRDSNIFAIVVLTLTSTWVASILCVVTLFYKM